MTVLYPIYVDLAERAVLVVGGGSVAARKVASLLEREIRTTVVALEVCPELQSQATDNPNLVINQRGYRSADLENHCLVISATSDPELNRTVADDAARAGLFCNVVDQPQLCTFHVPAVVRRGLLQIAVSTSGASPALAAKIRRQLQEQFGPAYAQLLDGMLELRRCFQKKYSDEPARRQELLEAFLDSEAVDLLLQHSDFQSFVVELERWKSQ